MSDQNLVYVLDGAPITVRGDDNWSTRTFNRHLPVLYFFQFLESLNPDSTVITPVIDVTKKGRFDSLEGVIMHDFNRRTSISNLHIIDESRRKIPEDSETISRYIDFLNSFDYDLSLIDTNGGLAFNNGEVTGFNYRLSCTIAECLVYFDKMGLIGDSSDDVVLVTGYDESYVPLYGKNSRFKAFSSVLIETLSRTFNKSVEIIDFIYATNPGMSLREYSMRFSDFSAEEQEQILLSNTMYVLAMAHQFRNGGIDGMDLRDYRRSCIANGRADDIKSLISSTPIRKQEDFNRLSREVYHIISQQTQS